MVLILRIFSRALQCRHISYEFTSTKLLYHRYPQRNEVSHRAQHTFEYTHENISLGLFVLRSGINFECFLRVLEQHILVKKREWLLNLPPPYTSFSYLIRKVLFKSGKFSLSRVNISVLISDAE